MQLTLSPDRNVILFPKLPFGLLAYLGTGASVLVCYGKSILLASFAGSLEVPYFNPHVQAVLMWVLGALAVYGLLQDRRAHGSTAPLAIGVAGVAVIVATLYGYYDITIEITGYILLLTAAFLNQNVFLSRLNEQVKQQALEVQSLNRGLEQRVENQVDEIEKLNRLKRFLAPEVAELITEGMQTNLLKSHRAYIATLFCDLRGFTAFSSTMEPEEVMSVLQDYHETFGRLVADHGGTIDHRAGDGLMVFFNDPLPVEQPVLQAVRLALHMRRQFAELNRKWIRQGYSLGLGIGIASGYATLGIVGHEGRYDYTANGNAVNFAARLCDAAEDGQILISSNTLVDVNGQLEAESVGSLALKGLSNQTTAYNVLGERTGSESSIAQKAKTWDELLDVG